jgi:hypothetical protein
MLGLNERSVISVLFSETGLEPISYRRVLLLLGNLKYLVKNGLLDSLRLARQHKMSWVNDVVIVLSELSIPVYWKLDDVTAIMAKTIDGLITDVMLLVIVQSCADSPIRKNLLGKILLFLCKISLAPSTFDNFRYLGIH